MSFQNIDHSLSTIDCLLDGMSAIMEMMMEVEKPDKVAVGYIMISCISEIRTSCAEIRKEVNLR